MGTDDDGSGSFQALADFAARMVKVVMQTGDTTGLNDAINLLERIIAQTPPDLPDRAGRLSNLSVALQLRFDRDQQQADLDRAAALAREAVAATRPDDPDAVMYRLTLLNVARSRRARRNDAAARDEVIEAGRAVAAVAPRGHQHRPFVLYALGLDLLARSGQPGHAADLDEAIGYLRDSVAETAPDDSWYAIRALNLAVTLQIRSERTGSMPDIDEAIALMRATKAPEGERAKAESSLCGALKLHASRTGDQAELDEAIGHGRMAVELAAPDDPARAGYLNNLAGAVKLRFQRTGRLEDLNEAVSALTEAVAAVQPDSPDRPAIVATLGGVLLDRFAAAGDPADLEQAMSRCRAAVAALSDGGDESGAPVSDSLSRVVPLANLSATLLRHYQQTGDPTELDEAIALARDALAAIPPGYPQHADHLSDLSERLRIRFWHSGNMGDLTEAIETGKAALAEVAADYSGRGKYLTSLAGAFHARFWRTGDMTDLDEAIRYLRAAVAATPLGWNDYPVRRANLGMGLELRAIRTGSVSDLDEAISELGEALGDMKRGDRLRPLYLSSLGAAYLARFNERGDLADLDHGIQRLNEGVAATPPGSPDRCTRLSNLGGAIQLLFDQTREPAHLDAAIQAARDAVAATSLDHPSYPTIQASLAARLLARFELTGNQADLAESVDAGRAAVAACPPGYPGIAYCLRMLGDSLYAGSAREEAFACWRQAADTSFAPASLRINAAVAWGNAAAGEARFELAEEGFTLAVGLLPLLAWRGLDRGSQEQQLAQRPGVASDAAACAIAAGHLEHAVELLEHGRGVLWSQLLQLRGEVHDLRRSFPDLADRLDAIRALLDPMSAAPDLGMTNAADAAAGTGAGVAMPPDEGQGDRRMRSGREWDELIAQIRQLPGFASFLDVPSFSELASAGGEGAVVMVNVSRIRCDALVVADGTVTVIPLTGLAAAASTDHANQFLNALRQQSAGVDTEAGGAEERHNIAPDDTIRDVLTWLSETVTSPVLAGLGLTGNGAGPDGAAGAGPATLPRVWWCPTGALTVLPLHAADRVLDHVVSSYTPTLRALRDARNRLAQANGDGEPRMLLVTMPVTPYLPGGGPLEGAAAEAQVVGRRFLAATTHLTESTATVADVLGALRSVSYAHFACHGSVNPADPSGGGLYLYDGPLAIRQLSATDLPTAEFAFLSACETATGSVRHLDEAITMAAAIQLAGFRHVIATMWSIVDTVAPAVARDTYVALDEIASSRHAVTSSARALHAAVRSLRAAGYQPAQWAPFIHTGP